MKKRIKEYLTHKRATILLSILMAIFAIALTIYLIVAIRSESFNFATFVVLYGLIFAVAPALGVCIGSIKPNSKKQAAANLQEKNIAISFLTKEKFTELSFTPQEDDGGEYEMLLAIQKGTNCKFFAKLNEDDKIILIVKDKDNVEIYNCKISNYYYFNLRFKKK